MRLQPADLLENKKQKKSPSHRFGQTWTAVSDHTKSVKNDATNTFRVTPFDLVTQSVQFCVRFFLEEQSEKLVRGYLNQSEAAFAKRKSERIDT